LLSAISILAGAFGAHGLKTRLDPAALELWETAARYLMYAGLGVTLVGFVASIADQRGFQIAGWIMVAGAVIFSGTVALLALGGPRWLGAVTPIGGLLLIAGFVLFAWTSLRL
jgi:uncharacterized membrane protein YgdD (TMEM256/DUF423 family)